MRPLPPPPDAAKTLDRLQALCEPVRRDLYLLVAARDDAVSRDEAAEALGLRRGLVAHHLDRLAADGLLEVEYRRLTGRSGPGAGRPAKLYRRTEGHYELSIPPRNPLLLAELVAQALDEGGAASTSLRVALRETARRAGAELTRPDPGRRTATAAARRELVVEALRRYGYRPRSDGGVLALRNCPYAPLATDHRDVVCGMNLALVEGVVEGAGLDPVDCRLAPDAGRCCVIVEPWPDRSKDDLTG